MNCYDPTMSEPSMNEPSGPTTITRLGTWDDVFGGVPAEVRTIAEALRGVVLADMPDAVEVPRAGDRAASYGVGEKKMSQSHCYLQAQRNRVNLGFWHGTSVPDPDGLLEGTGKALRHAKVESAGAARSPAIAALVRAAREERAAALRL